MFNTNIKQKYFFKLYHTIIDIRINIYYENIVNLFITFSYHSNYINSIKNLRRKNKINNNLRLYQNNVNIRLNNLQYSLSAYIIHRIVFHKIQKYATKYTKKIDGNIYNAICSQSISNSNENEIINYTISKYFK